MKKSLMMLFVLSGCITPGPIEPEYTPTFRILQDENGKNMACMDSEDTQKLWKVLNQCQGVISEYNTF